MTMRTLAIAAAAAISLAAAAPAAAQDVSGTWEFAYTMETPRGSMDRTMTVQMEQDGTALTGTAEMAAMGRPGGGGGGGGAAGQTRTVDISNGMVAGNEVMFTIILNRGERTFQMTFAGQVDGDAMQGTVSNPMGGDSPFTATRKEDL
jgi:hypothetical protein